MSSLYSIEFEVSDLATSDEIVAAHFAVQAAWPDAIETWDWSSSRTPRTPFRTHVEVEGYLRGTSDMLALETAKLVWRTLRRFVPVEIRACCLEDIPYEYHAFDDERRYAELMADVLNAKEVTPQA